MERQEIGVRIKRGLKVGLGQRWFRNVVGKLLEAESITGPVELGVVITDTETVMRLNKSYRQKDEPTDVIAFQMIPDNHDANEPAFAIPPDGVTHLGEVVISYPIAVQQAQEQGHSVEQELVLLTVHGVLHLLGYDHERDGEGRRMRAREKRIMGILGYSK
jgi:probable rRNA maturation factor